MLSAKVSAWLKKRSGTDRKVDANQMLHFYGNLYTMGVNCLMVDQYMDSECRIQLPELVSRPGQNKPDTPEDEKKTWIENPSLHPTALYFMQELRRQKFETMPEELKEMQEEILADFAREPTLPHSRKAAAFRY